MTGEEVGFVVGLVGLGLGLAVGPVGLAVGATVGTDGSASMHVIFPNDGVVLPSGHAAQGTFPVGLK